MILEWDMEPEILLLLLEKGIMAPSYEILDNQKISLWVEDLWREI